MVGGVGEKKGGGRENVEFGVHGGLRELGRVGLPSLCERGSLLSGGGLRATRALGIGLSGDKEWR